MATVDDVFRVRDDREALKGKIDTYAHRYEQLGIRLKTEPQSVVFDFEDNKDLDRTLQKKTHRLKSPPDLDAMLTDLKAYREILRREWELYQDLPEKDQGRVEPPPKR